MLYVSWCILYVSYMYLKQRMEYIRIHTEYTTIHVSTPSHMARPVRLWDTPGYNGIQQDTSARAYPHRLHKSPDLNICDLAFFRGLKCSVRKKRRLHGHGADGANYSPFDVEQLVKDVMGECRLSKS